MNDRPTEEEPGRPFLVAGQWWWRGQRVWWAHRTAQSIVVDVAAVVVGGPCGQEGEWVQIEAEREDGERVRVHASPWRLRQC